MLTPAQVIPFLRHDDKAVRHHSAHYLIQAHDPSPATADDIWRAVDQFGMEDWGWVLSDLGEVPQTEQSCRRTIDALRAATDEDLDYHLQQALTRLDFPLLLAHREELLADEKLLPHVREHLQRRVELSDRPPDELWDALSRHSDEIDRKYWGDFDERVSRRLIEAMARHGEPAAQRALERLGNGVRGQDYLEIFCVQLLGELRHAPATEALVERLIIEDADILNEQAVRALARIGTVEVIERLEAIYPSQEWGVRLFVDDPLGRIKRPESERALLRMLAGEPEEDLRTFIANELCDLCTTEGLEEIRRMVLEDEYDPQIAALDEQLLTVATMTGYTFPEAAEVRKTVERRVREREERLRRFDSLDSVAREMRERWRRGVTREEPRDHDAPPPGGAAAHDWVDYDDAPAARPGTYRREEPKVGRNDPCPCGSGKKYKKCCLERQRA